MTPKWWLKLEWCFSCTFELRWRNRKVKRLSREVWKYMEVASEASFRQRSYYRWMKPSIGWIIRDIKRGELAVNSKIGASICSSSNFQSMWELLVRYKLLLPRTSRTSQHCGTRFAMFSRTVIVFCRLKQNR